MGTFCWASPHIYDTKTSFFDDDDDYDSLPAGTVIRKYRQKVRIRSSYLCPESEPDDPFAPLGTPEWWGENATFEITYRKADGHRYTIEVTKISGEDF